MLIFLAVTVVIAAIAATYLVSGMVHVRLHISRLTDEGQGAPRRWRISRAFNIFLLVIVTGLLPTLILMPQFAREILYVGIVVTLLAITRYRIIDAALQDIGRYRTLYNESTASSRASEGKSKQYVQDNLHEILHKDSFDDLLGGDHVTLRSKILLVDFHNRLAGETNIAVNERFNLMASWINEAGSILHANGCIIAQSTGSGLIAIFGKDALGVIDAVKTVDRRINTLAPPAEEGRGNTVPINYTLMQGLVTIAIVSNGRILQSIIASETIDLAYQIQNLSQRLHIPMIIDEFSRRAHEQLGKYSFRYIGFIQEKASGQIIKTHEILDLYDEDQKQRITENIHEFEDARRAHERGEFRRAYSRYTNVVSNDPFDLLAKHFQNQCSELIAGSDAVS